MVERFRSKFPLIAFFAFFVGCSIGVRDISPLEPAKEMVLDAGVSERAAEHERILLGLWDCVYNADACRLDLVPLRETGFHLNAVSLMNQAPLSLQAKVLPVSGLKPGELVVDVTLQHPKPNPVLRGFDTRGIIIGISDCLQGAKDDPDLLWLCLGMFRLKNADGYTRWWNPNEFETEGLFGYTPGAKGSNAVSYATLNPYKYFATGLGPTDAVTSVSNIENRGSFAADGGPVTRRYVIQFPVEGGVPDFRFQYAVDTCWAAPTGGLPNPELKDFPPNANCPEAFCVQADASESTLFYKTGGIWGGDLILRIEVFDWGAEGTGGIDDQIQMLRVSCPVGAGALFDAPYVDIPVQSSPGSSPCSGIYSVTVPDVHPSSQEDHQVLVTVVSKGPDSYKPPVTGYEYPDAPLAAYCIVNVPILKEPMSSGGWVLAWGGTGQDASTGQVVNAAGEVYVIGGFEQSDQPVDFDPGPGTCLAQSKGLFDCFMSKFDSEGNLLWNITWGGVKDDAAMAIAIDQAGDVYVTGCFRSTVDFDPGPGQVLRTSKSSGNDIFLSKYSASGALLWVNTWGGTPFADLWLLDETGADVWADKSGNILVTGGFVGKNVDFDPGPGQDLHSSFSTLGLDIFVAKYEPDGDFLWARTWGSELSEMGLGVTTGLLDTVYVTGYFDAFSAPIDFDPGPGEDMHQSNGGGDSFLSVFNYAGEFQWARTWGGADDDATFGIATSENADGYLLLTGNFKGTSDFDPSGGTEIHSSNGSWDAFITAFSLTGTFLGADTWGGASQDFSFGVDFDSSDNAVISACFSGQNVDLDPGPGEDIHTAYSPYAVNVSRFNDEREYSWARTWNSCAGSEPYRFRVRVDEAGNIYVPGAFSGTVDFDPGFGVQNRTAVGMVDAYLIKLRPNGHL